MAVHVALYDKYGVSDETRLRIKEIARKLKYRASPIARSNRHSLKSGIAGIVFRKAPSNLDLVIDEFQRRQLLPVIFRVSRTMGTETIEILAKKVRVDFMICFGVDINLSVSKRVTVGNARNVIAEFACDSAG